MTGLLMYIPVILTVVAGIYFLILNWKIDSIKDDIKEIKRKIEVEQ
jgi:uncharacterized membrane protein